MSWSFSGLGKPHAVFAKAKKDLTQYKCAEPEESIKQMVLNILDKSLSAYPESYAVHVEASGSQSSVGEDKVNQLRIDIHQLYGFIE